MLTEGNTFPGFLGTLLALWGIESEQILFGTKDSSSACWDISGLGTAVFKKWRSGRTTGRGVMKCYLKVTNNNVVNSSKTSWAQYSLLVLCNEI